MIIKFRIYESLNDGTPEVGDYVIIGADYFNSEMNDFFNKEIGIITGIDENEEYLYYIRFEKPLPSNNGVKYFNFSLDEIKYWAKDRKLLESILNLKNNNKFNL